MTGIHRYVRFARTPRADGKHTKLSNMAWGAPLVVAMVAALLAASSAVVQAQAGLA